MFEEFKDFWKFREFREMKRNEEKHMGKLENKTRTRENEAKTTTDEENKNIFWTISGQEGQNKRNSS